MAKPIQLAIVGLVLVNQHLSVLVSGMKKNVELESDEYSWSVKIRITDIRNGTSKIVCGGAVISDKNVITAAHCVFNKTSSQDFKVEIILPAFNKEIPISQIKLHPGFDTATKIHDLAILTTALSITAVQPGNKIGQLTATEYSLLVQADSSSSSDPTQECYIITYNSSSDLIRLPVRLATEEECQEIGIMVRSDQICAIGPFDPRVTYGFSGSPLICKINTKNIIYGIVSHGFKDYRPDIYTNVLSYYSWISSEQNERLFINLLEYCMYCLIFFCLSIMSIFWLIKKFKTFRLLQTQNRNDKIKEFKNVNVNENSFFQKIPIDKGKMISQV